MFSALFRRSVIRLSSFYRTVIKKRRILTIYRYYSEGIRFDPKLDSNRTRNHSWFGDEFKPLDEEQQRRFDAIMNLVRGKGGNSANSNFSITFGPYYACKADEHGRRKFLGIIDKWWIRTKRRYENRQFKVSSVIHHLGRLNSITGDGYVLEKIGGECGVDFLLERWLKLGLDRLDFEDVLAGLSGLRDLCFDGMNGKMVVDRSKLTRWDTFFTAFEQYCVNMKKRATRDEWTRIIDSAFGVGSLALLRQMAQRPSPETLRYLNEWAVHWVSQFGIRMKYAPSILVQHEGHLGAYADFWLWSGIDPDTTKENSLSLWFRSFDIYLRVSQRESHAIPLRILHNAPSIALKFDRLIAFNQIYEIWHNAVLDNLSDTSGHFPPSHRAVDLADMIFDTGKLLLNKNTPDHIRRKQFELADRLVETFCRIEPALVSWRALRMGVTGFRDIKSGTSTDRSFLPDNLEKMLRQWLSHTRQSQDNISMASKFAGATFYDLARAKLHGKYSLWNELSDYYFWGLDYSPKHEMANILWQYAAACCYFNYDPSRNVSSGESPWSNWFKYAVVCLENDPASFSDSTNFKLAINRYNRLLKVILSLAARCDRLDEFREIQQLWEEAFIRMLPWMSVHLKLYEKEIKKLEQMRRFRFNSRITAVFDEMTRQRG